jgi:hypothetical protein
VDHQKYKSEDEPKCGQGEKKSFDEVARHVWLREAGPLK